MAALLRRKTSGKNKPPGFLTRWIRGDRAVVGHVRLRGAIGTVSPLSTGLTLETVDDKLKSAFAIPGLAAVAVTVNSPGGSPVQSALIFERIRQLADEREVKVLTFCEDVAASGGYLLALSGDEIFAGRSSIIGSIGVISAGFGFVGAMKKLGVERRVYTAGINKSVLDPFQPEKKADVEHLKALQLDIHEAFKDIVRSRREGKLKGPEKTLFSGLFWAGDKALQHGLIDAVGSMHSVLKARYGHDVIIKTVNKPGAMSLRRLLSPGRTSEAADLAGIHRDAASGVGAGAVERAFTLAEERALWSRYGL